MPPDTAMATSIDLAGPGNASDPGSTADQGSGQQAPMEGVAAPSTSGAAQGPANGPPPLHEALSKILSASGGLSNPKHLPALESLLAQQTEPGPRGVLLMVVTMSTPEIQTLIVRGKGVKALESWVVEAAEGRDSNPDAAARAKFIQDVINCLSKLPVDLDVLKQSGIGRTFGKLPKSLSAAVLGDHVSEVAAACKALVDQWKGLLNNAPGKAGAAAKQQAGGSSGAGASDSNGANKRREPSQDAQQAAASSKRVKLTPISVDLPTDDTHSTPQFSPTLPPYLPSPTASQPHSQPAAAAAGDTVMEPAVAGTAAQEQPGSQPVSQPAAASTSQSDSQPVLQGSSQTVIPTGSGSGVAQPSSEAPAAGPAATTSTASNASGSQTGPAAPQPAPTATQSAGAAASGTSTGQPSTSAAAAAAPAARPAGTGRTGGFKLTLGRGSAGGGDGSSRLGSLRIGTGAGRLGSLRDTQPLTGGAAPQAMSAAAQIAASEQQAVALFGAAADAALATTPVVALPAGRPPAAERAAAAAASVDDALLLDPDLRPVVKAKRKRVHWPDDDTKLQHIRWFRRDDPPIKAAQDVPLGRGPQISSLLAGTSTAAGMHAPGFERAARREHAREREVLAAQHKQEEKDRAEMLKRLETLTSNVPYATPPLLYIDPGWLVSAGDDSAEKHIMAVRCSEVPPVSYPTPQHVPPNPSDAPAIHDKQPIQQIADIPRIPIAAQGVVNKTAAAAPAATAALPPPPPVPAVVAGAAAPQYAHGPSSQAAANAAAASSMLSKFGVMLLPTAAQGAAAPALTALAGQQPAPIVLLGTQPATAGQPASTAAPAAATADHSNVIATLNALLGKPVQPQAAAAQPVAAAQTAQPAAGSTGSTGSSQPAAAAPQLPSDAAQSQALSALLSQLASVIPVAKGNSTGAAGTQPAAAATTGQAAAAATSLPLTSNLPPLLPSLLSSQPAAAAAQQPQPQHAQHQHTPLLPGHADISRVGAQPANGVGAPPAGMPRLLPNHGGYGAPAGYGGYGGGVPARGEGPSMGPGPGQGATHGPGHAWREPDQHGPRASWDKPPGRGPPGGEGGRTGAGGGEGGYDRPRGGGYGDVRRGGGRGGGGGGRRVCAYFNTPGGCKKGDTCDFLHIRDERR